METLVNSIIALSSNGDLQQLLNQLKASDAVLANNYASLPAAVQGLDPVRHTLGQVFLLDAQAKGRIPANGEREFFIQATSRLLREGAANQIQMVPETFCHLCHKFKEQVVAAEQPRVGILPLLSALQRLRPSPAHLTPIHSDVLQLCLLSHCYAAAGPLLAEDVLAVDPARTALTPADVQLYCYYGGMVAIGRKQLGRALELLLQGITAPTYVASAITLAAFKKYVLVSLIHSGALAPLPKFTPGKVKHTVETEARPYTDLATAYASGSAERLRKSLEHHAPTFAHDGNAGLVRQVQRSFPARAISRLTSTFLTLSLEDIANSAGLPGPAAAEAEIVRMVAAGRVAARINARDGMVTFDEACGGGGEGGGWSSEAAVARVEASIQAALEVAAKVQALHDTVSADRQYQNKLVMRERQLSTPMDEFAPSTSLVYPG